MHFLVHSNTPVLCGATSQHICFSIGISIGLTPLLVLKESRFEGANTFPHEYKNKEMFISLRVSSKTRDKNPVRFLPFRILDGIVRRPLLNGRDLLQPLHQMLIVDHVLRLRRVHVVRVPPAAHGALSHAAAASPTRPVHEPRGGDGGKAAARRDAAAPEGLLLRQLVDLGGREPGGGRNGGSVGVNVQWLLHRRRDCRRRRLRLWVRHWGL